MRTRFSAQLLLLSAVASIAAAQNPPATPAPATLPHLAVSTHLVTVEIVIAATAWGPDGKALTGNVLTRSFTLTPAQYRDSGETGLQFHQTLDIPSGSAFLRLGIYDPASGHMDTLEIPCPSASAKTTPPQ